MRLAAALLAVSVATGSAAQAPPKVMTPQDLMALPVRQPDHVLRYGPAASQFGELRLPKGRGPHPVVVLVHGGCWSSYAGAKSIGAFADALKSRGIATWSIEYRRLPEDGSGWPGTYRDTAAAVDHLRTLATSYPLELDRVVFVGHSAGGHLALWAAARRRLKSSSPLYVARPLAPRGVVNLAGRMDMTQGIAAYEKLCNGPVITSLLGGSPSTVPERYADASPSALLPLGIRQVMIWGEFEDYVPAAQVTAYVDAAQKAGDDARLVTINGIGHFETASPFSTAWPAVYGAISDLLGPAKP